MKIRALFAFAIAASLAATALPALAGDPDGLVPQAEKKVAKTGIGWNVQPSNVIIYLDGKKIGDAGSLKFTEAKPGKHAVRLVRGGDETEMDVKGIKGEVLSFEFAFEDG